LCAAGLTGDLALLMDRKEATEDDIPGHSRSLYNKLKKKLRMLIL
jgi:hypothetical protein